MRKKKYKVILSLLIITLILFNSFILQVQQVEAIADPVTLGLIAVPIVKMMIAGGVTFATVDGMVYAYNKFIGNPNNGTICQSIENQVRSSIQAVQNSGALTTGLNIANETWNNVKSWFQSIYQPGENIIESAPDNYYSQAINPYTIPDNQQSKYPVNGIKGSTYNYQVGLTTLKVEVTEKTSTYIDLKLYKGSTLVTNARSYFQFGNAEFVLSRLGSVIYAQINGFNQSGVYLLIGSNTSFGISNLSPTYSDPNIVNHPYTGAQTLSNPSHDWVNPYTNLRDISLSIGTGVDGALTETELQTELQSLINVSADGVINQYNPPLEYPPIVYPWGHTPTGTWEGQWTGTAGQLGTWQGTYRDDPFNPPWEVDWEGPIPIPFPFPLTFTGAFPVALGNMSGVQSGTPPPPPPPPIDPTDWTVPNSANLDFSPLIAAAAGIKDKFPFSIPWDMYNSIKQLMATPDVPKLTLTFPPNYFVGGTSVEISFEPFEPIAKILRWSILIIFNVMLIINTRKYIGAGGS